MSPLLLLLGQPRPVRAHDVDPHAQELRRGLLHRVLAVAQAVAHDELALRDRQRARVREPDARVVDGARAVLLEHGRVDELAVRRVCVARAREDVGQDGGGGVQFGDEGAPDFTMVRVVSVGY